MTKTKRKVIECFECGGYPPGDASGAADVCVCPSVEWWTTTETTVGGEVMIFVVPRGAAAPPRPTGHAGAGEGATA